ncbi:MAG: hypothetical protein NTX65_10885 [Ignavibacteriales bacterium]|nr:hypothetical protein [Ignavibacteriales bacterium]
MGFSTLLDIIGSVLGGGFLLVILMRMNATAIQNNYEYSGERIVQQNLVEVVTLIENDFRKIGYWNYQPNITNPIPDPAVAIIQADSTSITFLTDIVTPNNPYGDGTVDNIKYYVGPTSDLLATPNPNDRMLYRVINNSTPAGSNLGVTQFKLTYFDASGVQITNMPSTPPFGINTIQIDVAVENPAAYGNNYSTDNRAIWRQVRLASRNFTLR